ncbi:hypothetical protein MNKW57_01460 [Biformimicrobium ophioploci]|uniref:Uncharacterized protein n=1 Tax=Biformimicrobium ophioploci TaxID=3036711 RepID=A0ABQ6LUQ9_9GAMM|nr:hypothetical protein MNKW57_01460 [Microbulbifer sp. NKW57]
MLTDITDVVHAHIPLVTIAIVGVGKTTGCVVLLQHQNFFACISQADRGGKPADAGTYDYCVVRLLKAAGAVPAPDPQATGFWCRSIFFLIVLGGHMFLPKVRERPVNPMTLFT